MDEALRISFPTGLQSERVWDERRIRETQQQVSKIGADLEKLASLQICHQYRLDVVASFAFGASLATVPTAEEWVRSYGEEAKRAYLSKHGLTLTLFWASFSAVFPVWHSYFEIWTWKDESEAVGRYIREKAPCPTWATALTITERVAASYGFERMDEDALRRPVDFVRYPEIPEIYSEDDEDKEPVLLPCRLFDCLF